MKLSGECMLLGSLSHHSKDLEWRTLKSPQHVTALGSWTNHVIALRQISVTALFYLEDGESILEEEKRVEERSSVQGRGPWGEREEQLMYAWRGESPLAPFLMFFYSHWACPMQIGLSQERCSTWRPHSVLGPPFDHPLFCFHGLFPFLVF